MVSRPLYTLETEYPKELQCLFILPAVYSFCAHEIYIADTDAYHIELKAEIV